MKFLFCISTYLAIYSVSITAKSINNEKSTKPLHSVDNRITWQEGNWAYACDFFSNDLLNMLTQSQDCGPACASIPNCTHFTWTEYESGTCWLKQGNVSALNATYTNDFSMICGFLTPQNSSSNNLIWSDEFDSYQLNETNWIAVNGSVNGESQFYTANNAFVNESCLVVEARKEKFNQYNYTSAKLMSRVSFKYGIFEARIKLPKGSGIWSAFSLQSNDTSISFSKNGKINVMEHSGSKINNVYYNIHCAAYGSSRGSLTSLSDSNIFHIYRVDWNSERIKFYIDGIAYYTYYKHMDPAQTWPFDRYYNIIINLAIRGSNVNDNVFPQDYLIDYVRVYAASEQSFPKVSILAKANNKFVTAENKGMSPLIASRTSVSSWETFKLINNTDGSVSFLSLSNGLFVSADELGASPLIANRAINKQWERFIITPNSDGSVSLESQANWNFVSAENFGNSPLIANRNSVSEWESFVINFDQNEDRTLANKSVEYWQSDPIANTMLIEMPSLNFQPDNGSINQYTIFINENVKYQKIDGFGASLTDSSAWMLSQLSSSKQTEIIEKLFGNTGIQISLLRQPMGATDFARQLWSYSETNNTDDFNLTSFSLSYEDAYIRPMLSKALNASNGRLKIFATPWSPPSWMKENKSMIGTLGGNLRTDCYDVYADYFVKYINQNIEKGSNIYAITVQNEPWYVPGNYPGMYMSPDEQTNFIKNYLGPRLKKAGLKTKILVYDHNYDQYLQFPTEVTTGASEFVAGGGFHHYNNDLNAEAYLLKYKTLFPEKDIWMTECGFGTWMGDENSQFQNQMNRLIQTSRYWSKGLIMWNIALDEHSLPALIGSDNTNKGLLTIRSDQKDNVTFERGFFSLGHFSKFVNPNAYRINSNTFYNDIENVAFLNSDNTVVVIISSRTSETRIVKIKWNDQSFEVQIPPLSATTLKFAID